MAKRVRVVYTIADLQPENGGPTRSVVALADTIAAMADSSFHPLVCCSMLAMEYGPDAALPILPADLVNTTLLPCRGVVNRKCKYSRDFKTALLQHCRTVASDLIIHDTGVWLPSNVAAADVAGRLKGSGDSLRRRLQTDRHRVRFVISPRGMLTEWTLRFRGFKKCVAWHLYQKRALHSADVLHATSRAEAEGLRALGLVQPIAMIPNGVRIVPSASELTHRPTEGPKSRNTALFLGRVHPIKGLMNLVEAWDKIRPQGWRVVVAGGSENGHRAELESAIRERGLSHEFEFIGEVPDYKKWDLYNTADLFVLPSKSENFGMTVAEALGCGVPVIATKETPWSELETQRCGWWVEAGAGPLASALYEATIFSNSKRREMGRRGRELVQSKYTWPVAARQMVAVYRWMLGGGERPGAVACLQK